MLLDLESNVLQKLSISGFSYLDNKWSIIRLQLGKTPCSSFQILILIFAESDPSRQPSLEKLALNVTLGLPDSSLFDLGGWSQAPKCRSSSKLEQLIVRVNAFAFLVPVSVYTKYQLE